uniref:HTH cro/C1-type domain-containing protein n=2 Tax=Nelumbo nucifera TaxID=4432 RepID=A0A822ZJI8_NELNU|nr:TPA_asm: hypothetical protein HUJ06_002950 [Nelumbo nucifera]
MDARCIEPSRLPEPKTAHRNTENLLDIEIFYKPHFQSELIVVVISIHFLTRTLVLVSEIVVFSLSIDSRMPSRFPGALTQDWEPVVLHKSKPNAQALRDPKAVNQALRSGAAVQTVKKFDAGSNKKPATVVNARKLDEGTEPAALDKVSTEVRQAIQKARLAKKMSQAELAKLINERTLVVQEYENGKAVPNQAVLAKMEKVLKVKLRGKSHK